ncbi:MAG: peptidoglycan editing factor PgeF [Proteobacteria bacterium]|jgi:YfiH family protein|nr:peptidoglycan editing factor PgeF [Pseudomonadota bacterium]
MNNPQYIYPLWNAPSNVKSVITTRYGGYSTGKYASFNLATHVDDDLQTVEQNRQLLQNILPSTPLWLNQTHSTNILDIRSQDIECQDKTYYRDTQYQNKQLNTKHDYDAIIINNKNQVGVVMTADCAPILLTNKQGSFVAAIHAGWRGVLNNITSKTIWKLNTNTSDIIAYIGPSICQEHFEVGNDCYEQFIQLDKNTASYFIRHNDRFLCDLVGIIRLQLLQCGLNSNNIYQHADCTFCDFDKFYSYRRDGITGRIASLIWLNHA